MVDEGLDGVAQVLELRDVFGLQLFDLPDHPVGRLGPVIEDLGGDKPADGSQPVEALLPLA